MTIDLKELRRLLDDPDYTPDIYDYEKVWPLLPALLAVVEAALEQDELDPTHAADVRLAKALEPFR